MGREIPNYASWLNFTGWNLGWNLLWQEAAQGWRENFPLAEQDLAQRHDDKSSARTTSGEGGGVVTLARHNLFLLAMPRALKTLPKKNGGKTVEKSGDGGGNARLRWIIAATLPCEFNRTYCCEKCFVSAPQSRALHFRVQLYPRMLREMLLILVYFNMWRMDFIKFANHSKWNWTSCYFICAYFKVMCATK